MNRMSDTECYVFYLHGIEYFSTAFSSNSVKSTTLNYLKNSEPIRRKKFIIIFMMYIAGTENSLK